MPGKGGGKIEVAMAVKEQNEESLGVGNILYFDCVLVPYCTAVLCH